MSASIYEAAAKLQRELRAPAGAVNTIAQTRGAPPFIRVMIDPMYWHAVGGVPDTFEGFPVTVERREITKAGMSLAF
jgi:hypothetical protein